MVYHHRVVNCPNCGSIADRTRTVDSEVLKGSPFRVCPHCNEVYFDSEYHEPAIMVYRDKGGKLNIWGFIWFLLSNALVGLFLSMGIKAGSMDGLWLPFLVFLGLAILFDIGVIRIIINRVNADKYHQKSLDILEGRTGQRTSELAASMERMSNKAYLKALDANGVCVPLYFYERLDNISEESRTTVPKSVKKVDRSLIQQTDDVINKTN